MLEHFRTFTNHKIAGRVKAMVVRRDPGLSGIVDASKAVPDRMRMPQSVPTPNVANDIWRGRSANTAGRDSVQNGGSGLESKKASNVGA
jgi:hypothetical protein